MAVLAVGAGCSGPNHLGNPLLLPARAIGAAVENANYDRRRSEVKVWIVENEAAMRAEGFDGPVSQALLRSLPEARQAQAQRDLQEAAVFDDFAERATVIVMVLAG